MGEYLDQIPSHLRDHITKITASSGLGKDDAAIEMIAQAWLEKNALFESRIAESHMVEWEEFPKDEERGVLAMTYSGSLLTIGPLQDGKRSVDYLSIGIRQDVPETASSDKSLLTKDLKVDDPACFSGGPIERSSAIYKIAVSEEDLAPEEEQEKLEELTQILSEDFVEVNKTIIVP